MIQPAVTNENSSDDIAIIKADTQSVKVIQAYVMKNWRALDLIAQIDALVDTLRRNRYATTDSHPTL